MSTDLSTTTHHQEVVPVGAQRLDQVPNRKQRNQAYTELGSMKLEEGSIRIYANKRNGSLLIAMPDQSGFFLDAAVIASQCYKYWKVRPEASDPTPIDPNLVDEPTSIATL